MGTGGIQDGLAPSRQTQPELAEVVGQTSASRIIAQPELDEAVREGV